MSENISKQYFIDYLGVEDAEDVEDYEYKIDINKDDIYSIYFNKGTKEQYEAWLSFDFALFWNEEEKELTAFAKTLVKRMCDIAGN